VGTALAAVTEHGNMRPLERLLIDVLPAIQMHRSTLHEVNKKPRIGGRCGVSVFVRFLVSETPAAPAPTALGEQQIYR
jgi:hypothetical protein